MSLTEANKKNYPPEPRQYFCNKDGFHITIPQNATVPPLNLNEVWIPYSQGHNCKPKKRSKDDVTFSFLFTDCGAQSEVNVNELPPIHRQVQVVVFVTNENRFGCVLQVADGIITYWVNIEVKQHSQKGSIFRDTPFQ